MTAQSNLAGRSLFVTGGATGLGLAVAEAAVAAGYRVGMLDVAPDVDAVASGLTDAQGYRGSVTDPEIVEAAIDDFGTPDVLVNNAGIVRFGPLVDLGVDQWREVVDVNLTGTFIGARAVARGMIERRSGVIVNVTSMNGVAPGPNAGAYGSTKAAVALLTQQMAIEWGPYGIRVNAVAPGLIDGGMSAPIYADAVTRSAREEKVPLGRLGTPGDIADAVLFLADDRSAYITGQNLVVDGGVTMSMIANLPRPAAVDGVGPAPARRDVLDQDTLDQEGVST